ncbi:hypothetical protein RFI_06616 [Reticulomyxa filosa]|uniref:Uncharacterized protein n=1 Tax=Reticulomyxa filosa TaxID=46433 RepID=X6NZ04_RETFI|nr:hypothetical protein RFI_06616 [Reticulomyxa filosa]|eukprot:ETO30507.1 hypothetical protein RFI_06616 [Reticulomyxa filosa]
MLFSRSPCTTPQLEAAYMGAKNEVGNDLLLLINNDEYTANSKELQLKSALDMHGKYTLTIKRKDEEWTQMFVDVVCPDEIKCEMIDSRKMFIVPKECKGKQLYSYFDLEAISFALALGETKVNPNRHEPWPITITVAYAPHFTQVKIQQWQLFVNTKQSNEEKNDL